MNAAINVDKFINHQVEEADAPSTILLLKSTVLVSDLDMYPAPGVTPQASRAQPGIKICSRLIGTHENLRALSIDKTFALRQFNPIDKRLKESVNVQDADRLAVNSELRPRYRLNLRRVSLAVLYNAPALPSSRIHLAAQSTRPLRK
jgi:hypothetical protein